MNIVIISKLYTGDYIKKRIGHEIINFVKSDNGRNFVYINPFGTVGHQYDDDDVTALVFVYRINRALKILAYATVKERAPAFERAIRNDDPKEMEAFIRQSGINYGGVPLCDILSDSVLISYEVATLKKPKKALYLTSDKDFKEATNFIYGERFQGRPSHWVLQDGEKNDYGKLCSFIENADLWEDLETKTVAELTESGEYPYAVGDGFQNSAEMWSGFLAQLKRF